MNKESIEFESIPAGKDPNPLVRQSFRVPISGPESVQIIIRQKTYEVSDLNQGGVGILSENEFNFESGEILNACELRLTTMHLTGLTGRVVHCSSAESGRLRYGIQWTDLGPRETEILDEFLLQIKAGALKNNDRNFTTIY